MIDTKPLHWEKLEKDFKDGRSTVLFLGTGVNFGPQDKDFSWDALINHLLKYAISRITRNGEEDIASLLNNSASKLISESGYNGKILDNGEKYEKLKRQIATDTIFSRDVKTTIVKQKLGNEVYVDLIREFLYNEVSRERLEKSVVDFVNKNYRKAPSDKEIKVEFSSLMCITDLILRNKNIRAVITQNYDRFLCDAMEKMMVNPIYISKLKKDKGIDVRKIVPSTICDWKGQSKFTYDAINIYHVHGFIPRYDEIQAPKDNKIVLSMDEFYEDSRNVYSWQIASQLHFLSQYTCIFCGLSLDDYTNQRLLHYVRGKHHGNLYYLTAASNANGGTNDRIKNEFHEKNGLTVLYDEKGFDHLYNLLKDLQYEY